MTNKVAIKVNNLTKNYKLYSQPIDRVKESLNIFGKKYHTDFFAVKKLSFEVNRGETVGIIGRNGCGKSTLLKMITNVLTPTEGRVIVHGRISAILELGSGFNPEMTGLENIYLNASINGLTKDQTKTKIDEIMNFSELGKFINQPIKTYSSGMNARLAFAVAINVEPDILIVDEALSVGDAAFQRKCFAKMEEIRANGATILFVSHSEGSIVDLCNRAIWLSNGEQILDGVPNFVTGLYLKYSEANNIDKDKVRAEYDELVVKADNKQKNRESKLSEDAATVEKDIVADFYNPSIKSTSAISYEEKNAKISDVQVKALDGRVVNVLIQGREYQYQYTVDFDDTPNNVQFGFLIKTKNGMALGGGAFPDKNTFVVAVKKKVTVKFNFYCELNNGDYYFNAGVLVKKNEKIEYGHRILDAFMVHVIEANPQMTSRIDLISKITVEES